MKKYLEIGKENLQHNMPVHLLAALGVLCLSPFVLGIRNLNALESAKVLEYYVVLIGIILLPPIFSPEQNEDLRDLICSKYTGQAAIYTTRAVQAVLISAAILALYIAVLRYGGCEIETGKYFGGTFAGLLFLGGLGVFAYALTDIRAVSYMVPIIYYMINFGGGQKYVKMFYLFSMMGGSYTEKYVLMITGVLLLAGGIMYRSFKRA